MRRALVLMSMVALVAGTAPARAAAEPQGEFDHAFGTHGFRVTDMGGTDIASDVVPWGNRAVVFGTLWPRAAFIARYTPAGRLDRTFHRDGRITIHMRAYVVRIDAAVTPGGHLVVMVDHYSPTEDRHGATTLFRYGRNGWLDDSFGMDGRIDLPRVEGSAVAGDGLGRILLAGRVYDGSASDGFAVVRLTAGGRRDRRFSDDGVALASFPFRADATGVMVDRRGRVLLNGFGVIGGCSGGGCATPFLLARFGVGGRPDTSFGHDGRVRGPGDMMCTCAPGVSIDPRGRIVAGQNLTIARVLPDGRPDPTFGDHGVVDLSEAFESRFIRSAMALTTQPDRRILAVVQGHDSIGRVVRLTVDGRLDPTFGFRGRAPLPTTEHRTSLRVLALDPKGRIVAAGDTEGRQRVPLNVVVVRYT